MNATVTLKVSGIEKTVTTNPDRPVLDVLREDLHPVQEAFLEEGAMQCGYCTSGIILSTVALLHEHPEPTEERIVAAMNGNLCRCNWYGNILSGLPCAVFQGRDEEHISINVG